MKLKVNPLVVAAALGLLGPAALADEDDEDRREARLAGLWKRSGPSLPSPGRLGDALQVITVEGRVLLDDGSGSAHAWDAAEDGPLLQELRVDGARVTRRFEAEGDQLEVHTTVDSPDGLVEYTQVFVREE